MLQLATSIAVVMLGLTATSWLLLALVRLSDAVRRVNNEWTTQAIDSEVELFSRGTHMVTLSPNDDRGERGLVGAGRRQAA